MGWVQVIESSDMKKVAEINSRSVTRATILFLRVVEFRETEPIAKMAADRPPNPDCRLDTDT